MGLIKSRRYTKTQITSLFTMNSFVLRIQLPSNDPVLKRQPAYYVTPPPVVPQKTTITETPEWPTGEESFYDNRTTAYTWDDIVLTPEDLRRAAFNEAVYHATQKRLQRIAKGDDALRLEQENLARAAQELARICSNSSHVVQICDWV